MFSLVPNSDKWELPTFKTTPISGFTIDARLAISPRFLAPISAMQYLVFSSQRSKFNGAPNSLLKEFSGAIVGPTLSRM